LLTGETAKGDYPLEAVKMMHAISLEAEAAIHSRSLFHELNLKTIAPTDPTVATAIAAVSASLKVGAAGIIVITTTGKSAFTVAKYRPRCPIIAISRNQQATRQAHLHRGILPIYYTAPRQPEWTQDMDARIQFGVIYGMKRGFIREGDAVVLITGWREGAGYTNTMRIITASKNLEK